ncbi:transport and Golgi organization protein 6 homolog isoform X1 [Ctenocephalides felis]|uniref:transport and Golgi organization protein 6 homolog isoform X1 n=1 Tax=Ctenocephalides felis TaxID=7515 RepID=UPI000E6E4484|nr:transport and Golgi organization protein 6 homolog isoform X1 [Ctenocephalides felis]
MFLTTIMHNCNNDSLEKVLQLVSKLRSVNLSQEMKLLINEIHNSISRKLNNVPLDTHFSSDDSDSRYHKAINDVCDALLPVRAHGILELGKLIHENDNEAIAKKHAILCILQENLKNEDSYIYLAVIKSLTEVSKVCPEDVIELLTQEYLNNRHDKFQKDGKEELRLKVGEALVKLIFNAEKSIVQKYKTVFLNTFLSGTHDEDFLVRSSAFSNLGELCNKLGSSMGTEIISEILNKVEHCIVNEKSPEVKRSSILLCTQLLRGLQMNENESEKKLSLLVLRPALTPLLRSLRISYENNEDETLKLHAQLAIEELENMIKDFFKLL